MKSARQKFGGKKTTIHLYQCYVISYAISTVQYLQNTFLRILCVSIQSGVTLLPIDALRKNTDIGRSVRVIPLLE